MQDDPTYDEAETRAEERIRQRAERYVAGTQKAGDELAVTREWLALAEAAEAEAELCDARAAAALKVGDITEYENWTQGARTQRSMARLARNTANN